MGERIGPLGTALHEKERIALRAGDVARLPPSVSCKPAGAHGARFGGYALYVKDNRLHYVHNYVGRQEFRLVSTDKVPQGRVALRFEFEMTTPPDIRNGKGAGGRGHLYINGKPVGSTEIPVTCPIVYALAGEGLTCGYDGGQEVTPDYESPFTFSGKIERVTVDVSGSLIVDDQAELRRFMARQ